MNSRKLIPSLIWMLLVVGLNVAAASWALVVGVSDYADPVLHDLHFAASDAREVALSLELSCGVPRAHLMLLTDEKATRSAIEAAFESLSTQVGSEDTVYIYLAGHGTNTVDRDGDEADGDRVDEAFLPYDAVSIDASTFILDDTLGAWVATLNAGAVVLFLDSCYSGGQSRDAGAAIPDIEAQDSIARDVLTAGLGGPMRGMLAACRPQQLAYEDPILQHGVFTHFLLRGLMDDAADENGDRVVSLAEVSQYVIRAVEAWSADRPGKQTPVLETPFGNIPVVPDTIARSNGPRLVVHYPFDQDTDDVAGGAVSINQGGLLVDGIIGGAALFDRDEFNNTYVRTRTSYAPMEGPFAVSLWFRAGPQGAAGTLFSTHGRENNYGAHYSAWLMTDGSVMFRTNDAPMNHRQDLITTSYRWDDGQWHHLVVQRFASGRKELWIDGQLEASEVYSIQNLSNADQPLTIGANAYFGWSPGRSYAGNIDDLRIYSGALDEDEIHTLLTMGIPDGPVTGLDPVLEDAIRSVLGRPDGALFRVDLLHLQRLEIDARRRLDLSGLELCRNLRSLTITGAEIENLAFLHSFHALIELDLEDNQIADLSPLSELTNIELLHLGRNRIEDISPLRNLTKLYELDLSHNRIEDLEPLRGLEIMKELILRDNLIEYVTPIELLLKVWYLDLGENRIEDLSPLTGLHRLSIVYLDRNGLDRIDALAGALGLEGIDLHGNEIVDIAPLAGLEWLGDYTMYAPGERTEVTLNLADNRIDDPSMLVAFVGLGAGDSVDLSGNRLDALSPSAWDALRATLATRGVQLIHD